MCLDSVRMSVCMVFYVCGTTVLFITMPAVQYSDTVNTVDSSCYFIFNKKINILKLLFLLLFKVV